MKKDVKNPVINEALKAKIKVAAKDFSSRFEDVMRELANG